MIKTHSTNPSLWVVVAEWFGAERTVFEGDLFACIEWAKENI